MVRSPPYGRVDQERSVNQMKPGMFTDARSNHFECKPSDLSNKVSSAGK